MEYPSVSKCSQKWGRATFKVSSLEYFLLNSSMTNALFGRCAKGSLALGSAAKTASQSSISSSGAGFFSSFFFSFFSWGLERKQDEVQELHLTDDLADSLMNP